MNKEELKLLIEEYEEEYKQRKYEGNIEEYKSLKETHKLLKNTLNYIDKLQKEIKNAELKGIKSGTTIEYIGKATYWRKDKIEKYFISKNKIRDKIKELEERNKMFKLELPEDVTIYQYGIEVLKELLGE